MDTEADPRVPLHTQIATHFRAKINDRSLLPGDALPTEAELQEEFSVSRSVVRQAMATLAAEGLVTRGRGRGSIVAPRRQHHRLVHRAAGLSAQVSQAGMHPGTRVLSLEREARRPDAASPLPPGDVYRLERVRSIDGVSVAFIRTWLPAIYAEGLTAENLRDASLHESITARHGIHPVGGARQVRAVPADDRMADVLGVHSGAPLLLLEGTTTDELGGVIEVFATWHRGDMIAFDLDIQDPLTSPHPREGSALDLAKRLVAMLEASSA